VVFSYTTCLDVASAPTADRMVAQKVDRILDVYATSTIPSNTPRSRAEIDRFFTGLAVVPPYPGAEPALTSAGLWGCEDPEVAESDGSRSFFVAVAKKPKPDVTPPGKPTVAQLGVDTGVLAWRRSTDGPGAIEVAFAWVAGEEWVLMRLDGGAEGRVSVFSRFEWGCFLDGVRNGEFDGDSH
jgi:hypothetical protein